MLLGIIYHQPSSHEWHRYCRSHFDGQELLWWNNDTDLRRYLLFIAIYENGILLFTLRCLGQEHEAKRRINVVERMRPRMSVTSRRKLAPIRLLNTLADHMFDVVRV